MKIILTIAAALSAAIVVVTGTNSDGVVYPFPIDNLLVCYVDNPLKGQDGQDDVIPEEIPLLPLDQIVRQNNHPNDIWLPPNPQFRTPAGIPSTSDLLNFLGSDYNPLLTATSRPARDAPLGCVVGGTAGSGGVGTTREPTPQSPTPLLLLDGDTFLRVLDDLTSNDPASRQSLSREGTLRSNVLGYDSDRISAARQVLLNDSNRFMELCEIWTGLCPLTPVWAELPDGYFPSFFSQGTCSGKNCSFPRAKHCEEDFTFTGSATVLRWDCCYNRELSQLRWDCGWRKVRIPIICDCSCACKEVNFS